jgi:hypothetical protein
MNDTDYIPIAALNQYAYCPHRCWRMFCAAEFTDNQYTIEGTTLHDRVHTTGEGHQEETWQIRAIWLKSERYQLIGKSDLIESESGQLYPVEYYSSRLYLLRPFSPTPTCRDFRCPARGCDRNYSIYHDSLPNRHHTPCYL